MRNFFFFSKIQNLITILSALEKSNCNFLRASQRASIWALTCLLFSPIFWVRVRLQCGCGKKGWVRVRTTTTVKLCVRLQPNQAKKFKSLLSIVEKSYVNQSCSYNFVDQKPKRQNFQISSGLFRKWLWKFLCLTKVHEWQFQNQNKYKKHTP